MTSALLTNSRVSAYRACPRKHHYLYVSRWRPIKKSHALRFGSAWHDLIEDFKNGDVTDWDALIAKWELDPIWDQVTLEALWDGYVKRWGEFSPSHRAEVRFECPLPHPDSWEVHSRFVMAGKLDGIDEPVLWEHKTSSELGDGYWARLPMNSQITHYMIGSGSLGVELNRIMYDVVKKPTTKPLKATPVEKRRKKKDGTYYANVREHDETPAEFGDRIRAKIAEDPSAYYKRREVPRLSSQLREYLTDLWEWADRIEHSVQTGEAPRNTDACHSFGACPYLLCCSTGTDPSEHPDLYHQVHDVHPELQEV